jgi:WhiB family transcriptional regulator, redox-sensing transcriptional regulator
METNPTNVMRDSDFKWQDEAKCVGMDTNIFFYDRGAHAQLERARKICGNCPVANDCLEFALTNHIEHGLWGGKSNRERRSILQVRARSRKVAV